MYKVPNIEPLLNISGMFESSNPICPIISHQLLEGEDNYDLIDNVLDFTLIMEEDDDEIEDVYPYTI